MPGLGKQAAEQCHIIISVAAPIIKHHLQPSFRQMSRWLWPSELQVRPLESVTKLQERGIQARDSCWALTGWPSCWPHPTSSSSCALQQRSAVYSLAYPYTFPVDASLAAHDD